MNTKNIAAIALLSSILATGCASTRTQVYNNAEPVTITQISSGVQSGDQSSRIFYGALPAQYRSADDAMDLSLVGPVTTRIAGNFAFSNKTAHDTLGAGWNVEDYLARVNKNDLESHLMTQFGLDENHVVVLDAPRVTVTNMTKTREECLWDDDDAQGKFMTVYGSVFTGGIVGAVVAISCANKPRIYAGEFTEQVTGQLYEMRPSTLVQNSLAVAVKR